jgi:hypothetical protein
MAKTYRKTKVVGNPGRRAFGSPQKKKYKRPAHATRSNPDIIGFTLAANTGRKVRGMAKTKKHHHKAKGYTHHRSNTGRTKHRKYRRNAGVGMGGLVPMVTNGAFVIIGALGSKLGTQAILGTKNVGVLGYAGNAAVGGVLWFITEKIMKNRAASTGVISGTIVQILLRIINDYTPFGQYVSQLGMGDYQMQSFVTPQVLVDPWRSAEVAIPPGWAPRMVAAPAAAGPAQTMPSAVPSVAGVSGLYGGGGGWGPGLYSA